MEQIARAASVAYEWGKMDYTDESNCHINEWLYHHIEEVPLHKLCYSSAVAVAKINHYFNEDGSDGIDRIYGMTPLHVLTMNPHAPADAIAALLDTNMEAAFCVDNEGKMPLDYAREYKVVGLVRMINILCNHRHATRDYIK